MPDVHAAIEGFDGGAHHLALNEDLAIVKGQIVRHIRR